jgi:AcrR family transcriptional regulator
MSIASFIYSDARNRLLGSAEELFAEHGYELASTRQIASAAGMNISLISYYFGSKKALYKEIFQTRLEELNLSLQNVAWHLLSAVDKLNKFLTIYTDRYRLNGNFQRMLYREILFLSKSQIRDVIENYLADNKRVFTAIIDEGIGSGDFQPLNSSLFFMTLISTMSIIVCDAPGAIELSGPTNNMDEIKAYLRQILLTNCNTINSMN